MSRKGGKKKLRGLTVPLPPSKKTAFLILIFTIIFSMAIFHRNLDDGLLVDDAPLIFMAKDFFPGNPPQLLAPDMGTYWRPLGKLSFVPQAIIWGYNPVPYHITSLILNIIAIFLVYIIGKRFLPLTWAAIAAAIFAMHPVHGGTLAWISARYDLLATVFVLSTLIFYLRHLVSMRKVNFILSLFFMILAFFSKEISFIAPILILLFAALYGPGTIWRNISTRYKEVLIYFFICVALLVVRWLILGGMGGPGAHLARPEIFALNFGKIFANYIFTFPYVFTAPVNNAAIGAAAVIKPLMFILGLFAIVALIIFRKNREIWVGLFFAMIACAPVSFFIWIDQNLQSAYMLYLPLAGFALFIAAIGRQAFDQGKRTGKAILIFLFLWAAFLPPLLFAHLGAYSAGSELVDKIRTDTKKHIDDIDSDQLTVYIEGAPATHKGIPLFFDEIDQILWPVIGHNHPGKFHLINDNFLMRHPDAKPFSALLKNEDFLYLVWENGALVDKTGNARKALGFLENTNAVEKFILTVVDNKKIGYTLSLPSIEIIPSDIIPATSIVSLCLKLHMETTRDKEMEFSISWIDQRGEFSTNAKYLPENDGNTCVKLDRDPRWAMGGNLEELYITPKSTHGEIELKMAKIYYKTQSIEIFEEVLLDGNDPLLQTILEKK